MSYRYVERPALARKREWQVGDRAGLGSGAPPAVPIRRRPPHGRPTVDTARDALVEALGNIEEVPSSRRDGISDWLEKIPLGVILV